jgi:type II secretory pathway component HofQ
MLNDRENILKALREKPLKVYEILKRANVVNEEACQSLPPIENARQRIGEVRYSQRAMAHRMIPCCNCGKKVTHSAPLVPHVPTVAILKPKRCVTVGG